MQATSGSHSSGVDRPSAIAAFSVLAMLGALSFNMLPLVLGSAGVSLGWSDSELGTFASSGMLGGLLATLSAPLWIRVWPWRRVVKLSTLASTALYWLLPLLPGFSPLVVCNFSLGFSLAVLAATSLAGLSDSQHTERNFGIAISVQTTISALFAAALGPFDEWAGFKGVTGLLGGVMLLGLVAVPWIPDRGAEVHAKDQVEDSSNSEKSRIPVLLSLASIVIFYIAVTAIWAFLESFGEMSEIDTEHVAWAISTSLLVGTVGSMLAAVLGSRIPELVGIASGSLVILFASVGLWYGGSATEFVIWAVLFNAGWSFALPYLMGLTSSLDHTRRYTVLLGASIAAGAVIGPVTAGVMLDRLGYGALVSFEGVILLLSCLTFALAKGLSLWLSTPATRDGASMS